MPTSLSAEILARLQALPGKIGFYASCPATGEVIRFGERVPMVAASVIKLPILGTFFRQCEAGLIDPEEEYVLRAQDKLPSCGALTYLHEGLRVTLRDLAVLMIIVSDNTATNLLIDRLGQDTVNAFLAENGITDSRLNRPLFRDDLSALGIQNRITAADMAHLLEKLNAGTLVSAKASAEMLQILGDQRLNGKLPFYLHAHDIACAHKTGEDDGITHDVGIIYGDPAWIVAFLSNETDVPRAERAIQDIGALLAGIPLC